MSDLKFTLPAPAMALFFAQIVSLILYLYLNILTIGSEFGVGLNILGAHVFVTFIAIVYLYSKKMIIIRLNYWVIWFALLISWLSLRVVLDLNDIYYLKQITFGTTGGILLFFILGVGVSVSYQAVVNGFCRARLFVYILVACFFAVIFLILTLADRMHENYFVITGINGAYQRPGNFLSIIYMLLSYAYVAKLSMFRLEFRCITIRRFTVYTSLFTLYTFLCLGLSQMIGSNSATGMILVLYVVTVMVTILPLKNLSSYMYAFSSKQLFLLFKAGLGVIFGVSVFLFVLFSFFDIDRLGIFGFGSGEVNSLSSRLDILFNTFEMQAGHSPIFGNMNVAGEVTGSSGATLHNLFPYVLANLGIIGLSLILLLLIGLVWGVRSSSVADHISNVLLGSYRIYAVIAIVFFANLSTGISWPVLWFGLGLFGGVIESAPIKKKI